MIAAIDNPTDLVCNRFLNVGVKSQILLIHNENVKVGTYLIVCSQ